MFSTVIVRKPVATDSGLALTPLSPEISNAIVEKKTEAIAASGADTLLAGDLGCLMNMAGKAQRQGQSIQARHIAEVLADMTDTPAIGESG